MLSKFNTIARLIIVLLLVVPIYPMPPAFASEITETETFDGMNVVVHYMRIPVDMCKCCLEKNVR